MPSPADCGGGRKSHRMPDALVRVYPVSYEILRSGTRGVSLGAYDLLAYFL